MKKKEKIKIGQFLFEREGKYKPKDKEIIGIKRLKKINFSGVFYIGEKDSNTDMILVKKGDLVISGINVAKGAMGIYRENENIVATIHYSSYTFDKKIIDISYFEYFLKSSNFIKLLSEQTRGGIKTEIKAKHLLRLEIELPDIETQKEIVLKIKKCLEKQNSIEDKIKNQKTVLQKLRQAILQDAIEGKLTIDWRKKNPYVEPASELLKKIKAEKEKLIAEKKIKKEKTLPEIAKEEMPFDLPKNWEWCRLGEIAIRIHYGFNASANHNKKEVRLLRITDIQNNKVEWENVPGCDFSKDDLNRYLLNENDILIARTGGTIGKSYIVKGLNIKSLFASYLIRIIPSNEVNSVFLKLLIESPLYWKQLYAAAWGAGQPNVNATSLSKIIFSMPSFSEQKVIVEKVENLMQKLDKLETEISQNQKTADMLMQAVLKEAFEE